MYRRPTGQMVLEGFILPFEGKLSANNRWVKLAEIIPWSTIEKDYADLFPSNAGTVAKPLRMAIIHAQFISVNKSSFIQPIEQVFSYRYKLQIS